MKLFSYKKQMIIVSAGLALVLSAPAMCAEAAENILPSAGIASVHEAKLSS